MRLALQIVLLLTLATLAYMLTPIPPAARWRHLRSNTPQTGHQPPRIHRRPLRWRNVAFYAVCAGTVFSRLLASRADAMNMSDGEFRGLNRQALWPC